MVKENGKDKNPKILDSKLYNLTSKDRPAEIVVGNLKELWDNIWEVETVKPKVSSKSQFCVEVGEILSPQSIILTLGTGGYMFDEEYFVEKGHKVVGMDFSKTAVDFINRQAREKGISSSFLVIEQDFLQPWENISSNSMDLVYAYGSTHYFNNEQMTKILKEAARVLKPEGKIAIYARSIHDWKNNPEDYSIKRINEEIIIDQRGMQMRFFSEESMRKLLKKASLKSDSIQEEIIERYANKEVGYKEPPSCFLKVIATKK